MLDFGNAAVRQKAEVFEKLASTAPYYVQVGNEKNRVSKKSAQFFLNWWTSE